MHKIPATVLSRCQRHEFRRVPVDDIIGQLKRIVESEKLTAEPEALTLIARQSAGGMRDAISLLDQMASTGQEITLGLTQTVLGTATSQTVVALVAAVLDRQPSTGMDAIHSALDAGSDPRLLARQVVDYLRALLLVQMGNAAQVDLAADTRAQAEKHAKAFSSLDVLRMIKAFNAAATDLRGGWQPSLPLELALAEVMEMPAATPFAPSAPSTPAKKASAEARPEKPEKTVNKPEVSPRSAAANASAERSRSVQPSGADRGVQKEAEKPVAQTAPESGSTVTLGQVVKAWKQVCAAVKPQSSSLNALLNSCKLLEVKDGVLMLGFASELLHSKADTPEQMEIARKAIAEILGVDVAVRCVVSNARQSAPPDVRADGMVAAALKAGGEIVDIQE
jgi:DNA polymerase-3 subunit gamma/tau